jgi:hypothetical protein
MQENDKIERIKIAYVLRGGRRKKRGGVGEIAMESKEGM